MGRLALIILTACALALLATSSASARSRPAVPPVPKDFFGVMVDGPMLEPGFDWDGEARLIRRTGIRSVRLALNWFEVAPGPATRDWSVYDRRIGGLAGHGVRVMPVLLRTPGWAATKVEFSAAPRPGLFEAFVAEAVRRYGHGGAFWREHPEVPYRPVRDWQIWNEPDHPDFLAPQLWPRAFVPILREGARAVRRTDRRARVIAPGLTNRPFEGLEALYRAGARGLFDAAAIHPYRETPDLVMRTVRRSREVMTRFGDGKAGIVLSEMSFTSGRGYVAVPRGVEETEAGQARRLRQLLRLVARDRRRFHIEHAYWYTWMSGPPGPSWTWAYSGVRRSTPTGALITKPALPALRAVIAETTGRRLR